MGLLAYINALERKVQRAAPGSYPGLATTFFAAGICPFMALVTSFHDSFTLSDGRMNMMRGLLACAVLAFWYIGRLTLILFFRMLQAPYRAGAPAWTTALVSPALLVLLASFSEGYILQTPLVTDAWHHILRLLAWACCVIGGGHANKAQKLLREKSTCTGAQTTLDTPEKQDGSTPEELSTIDQALYNIHDPEFHKKDCIITRQDMKLAILGWMTFECFIVFLLCGFYRIFQEMRSRSETTDDVPMVALIVIGLCLVVTAALLIFVPFWTTRVYRKWQKRQATAASTDATPVKMEDVEAQ